MNALNIMNLNRTPALWRLAGAALLVAALFAIATSAARADGAANEDSAQSLSPLLHAFSAPVAAPAAPPNLSGAHANPPGRAAAYIDLEWDAPTTVSWACILILPFCFLSDSADANLIDSYVVERIEPRRAQSSGSIYATAPQPQWTRIATVSKTSTAAAATEYRDANPGSGDSQTGASRTLQYRVKACNSIGCGAWSETASVTFR